MDKPSAKELYQSRSDYDASALADDDYPTAALAKAAEDSGLSMSEIARRLEWTRPDVPRLKRALGLQPDDKNGRPRMACRYETAVKIIRALDLDPMDYGL